MAQGWSWSGASRSGPASGGSLLTLQVFGLRLNIGYSCMFVSGLVKICSNARVMENSSISCISVAWGNWYPASAVGLYLLENPCEIGYVEGRSPKFLGAVSDRAGDPLKICNYPACWDFETVWFAASSSGRAAGGDNITVTGSGFGASLKYFLKFIGKYRNASTSLASPISSNLMTLLTPVWKGSEELTSILLQDSQGRTIQKTGGGSYFSFESCWISKDTSASSALALDSKLIVFDGAGFNRMSDKYQCVFSRDSHSVSTDAAPLDVNMLVCPAPRKWIYRPGVATLTVVQNQTQYIRPCKSETNESFFFLGGWFGLSASTGPALGGLNLTVTGFGFDVLAKYSSCIFGNNNTMISSVSFVVSDSQIVCQTPDWGNHYTHATVSVSVIIDGAKIEFLNRFIAMPLFEFYAVWTTAVTGILTSAEDSVLGGGILLVYGAGFDMETSYLCIFGVETSISPPTMASNVTHIRFKIPPWKGAAQTLNLKLINEKSQLVIPRINPKNALYGGLFTFLPSWHNISSGLLSIGQNKIILSSCFLWISGSGFDVEKNYTCVFRTNGEISNGIQLADFRYVGPAFVINENNIRCVSPKYMNLSYLIRLSVFDVDNNELQASTNNTFEVLCSWFNISPSYGSVLGGSLITMFGNGFSRNVEYICRFGSDSTANTSFASVINFNQITCQVPALRNDTNQTPMNVLISLSYNAGNCVYVDSNHVAALKFNAFEYVPSVQRSEPTRSIALGGVLLQIFGSGFALFGHDNCTFTSTSCSFTVSSPTRLANDQTLLCVTPFWPCPAGIVNLTFARSYAVLQFEYVPSISNIDKTSVLAKGNQQVRAFGAGFSRGTYLIIFSATSGEISNSSCRSEGSTLILCNVSEWRYEAKNVSISFVSGDGVNLVLNRSLELEFQAGWDSIDLSLNSGPSSGNSVFTVNAYGLNCASTYLCNFGRPGMQVKGICMCQSSRVLNCTTPQIGRASCRERVCQYV